MSKQPKRPRIDIRQLRKMTLKQKMALLPKDREERRKVWQKMTVKQRCEYLPANSSELTDLLIWIPVPLTRDWQERAENMINGIGHSIDSCSHDCLILAISLSALFD